MSVTITRYGGFGGLGKKTRTIADDAMTEDARRTLISLAQAGPTDQGAGQMRDAFTYVFEFDDDGATHQKVRLLGPKVPDALRALLP